LKYFVGQSRIVSVATVTSCLYHLKEGIEAAGDEAVIVNENRSGPTVEGEMTPTAPMAAMFGYGGDKQMHHTKGRRRELANNCREKKFH
jgi:DNA-binding winged helix-turn-helix (wHTH) protein